MKNVDIVVVVVIALVILSVSGSLFGWLEKRDEQLLKSSQAYEECVADQYRTTPTAYRAEHGEYPECDPVPYITN